jgi:hypothetical protein
VRIEAFMASWASSRSANRASSRAEAERSPGSVSWQSRLDDSARNSADGSTDRGDRRSDASRDDDSASRRYGETQDEGSVSKAARPLGFTTRRFTTGSDLRDRKHVGRQSRSSGEPTNAVTVSKNFVVFVCAGLAFFGLSVLGAGRSNRAFERHFQEIAKVRADRRRLREENEALARENARLRLEASGERGGGHDAAYHAPERLVQEVSAIDGSIGGSIGSSIAYGFRG